MLKEVPGRIDRADGLDECGKCFAEILAGNALLERIPVLSDVTVGE